MKKAIIIIPTYNEKKIIEKTVKVLDQVFKKIDSWQMEILVVDDTSPDKTYEKVEELQTEYKHLNLLINEEKKGLGAAYLKGMAHAFNHLEADVVFEFDADLSHNPEKIPDFLSKINQGYDFVLGSRYIKNGGIPNNWGLHRKFFSVFGNVIIRFFLLNFSIHDWTSGYRAITKKVYQQVVPQMQSEEFYGYAFQIGFLHKTIKQSFKVAEVPFIFQDRTVGHSKLGPEFIINALQYILKARYEAILKSRVSKFIVVGSIGALTQLLSLVILDNLINVYLIANLLAIELAVLVNFILSNIWTFGDRKLQPQQHIGKFIQFNLASAGSIIIQQVVAIIGSRTLGLKKIYQYQNFKINYGLFYNVVGIIIGMFWNFFAYNTFIWKKKV